MKIAIGADHAGFELKNQLGAALRKSGHEVCDFGTNSAESTDYPDYARQVAKAVAAGTAERGLLVCGSGVGMSIAANKVKGIRAALGVNLEEVRLTRVIRGEANDRRGNVLLHRDVLGVVAGHGLEHLAVLDEPDEVEDLWLD